jgi:transcriptional regulator with GAF, ATPase, and Fis domain
MELPVNKAVVCPTIVGRASELTALHAIVGEVEGGHSRVVLLSGESGIGKSRLVAEIETKARSRGFLVLQGNCFQQDLIPARPHRQKKLLPGKELRPWMLKDE